MLSSCLYLRGPTKEDLLEVFLARGYTMGTGKETIVVRANVEMTAASLQAIVANAKAASGTDEKGSYRIDTADKVSEMISRFLLEKDFEGFVKNADNY